MEVSKGTTTPTDDRGKQRRVLLLNWLGAPHLLFRMPGQQLIPCRNQEHFTPNARIDHGCRVAPDFLSPTQPVFASKPLDGTSSPGLPKSRVRNANAGVMFHTVTMTIQVFSAPKPHEGSG